MGKKYFTEEEKKKAKRENARRWREKHPEKAKKSVEKWRENFREKYPEYHKQYYQEHKEEIREYQMQYRQTPIVRANMLCSNYKRNDKKHNRGECTLTAEWIMENIFPKPCHWCGETGWEIMGCDRIDNELPHTPDNVNPCCKACNDKRGTMSYETFKKSLRAEETVL